MRSTSQGQQQDQSLRETPRFIRVELRTFPDGKTLALTPSGCLFRIEAEPEFVYQLLTQCDGRTPLQTILRKSPCPDDFSEVFTILARNGCFGSATPLTTENDWVRFTNEPSHPQGPLSTHLVLVGDPQLVTFAQQLKLSTRFASVSTASVESFPTVLEGYQHSSTIVVVLREVFDHAFLLSLNDFCADHQLRWIQFHIDQGHGWVGPAVIPNQTSDYRDCLGRRLCAAESLETIQALLSPTTYGTPYVPPVMEVMWMLTFLFIDIERWAAHTTAQTLCFEVEMDPLTLSTTAHPILPLPHRQLPKTIFERQEKRGHQFVFDERTGIVTALQRLEHHPSIPNQLVTIQSHIADVNRLYPWANNTVCSGSTFGDLRSAQDSATGEGLERYCGNWVQHGKLTQASYNELRDQGEYALDPQQMILYSDAQYNAPGFPFVPFSRDLKVHWVYGRSLTAGQPAWIPASFVYVNWYTGDFKNEPPTNNMLYPGLAAGPTLDFAIASALEEIIERHATMVWWTNRQPLPAVALTSELTALWTGTPLELGQRAWLIHLDNEFQVPVFAGLVENIREQLFNIGFATRPDPVQAALKAWTEALTLQEGSRDLADPHGLYRQAVAEGKLNGLFIKPWRDDRAYLDDYDSEFHDISDLMCQQQVFLDPRAREVVRPWVDVKETRSFGDLPRLSDRSATTYQKVLEERGHDIFYVDVTTPDVALTGARVVRVVVTNMVPNFPAAFPFLGKRRIQEAAVKLGWRNTPLEERELNYFPLPHA